MASFIFLNTQNNAPLIIVASVICLFIGCAAGKSGAQAEADATTASTSSSNKHIAHLNQEVGLCFGACDIILKIR